MYNSTQTVETLSSTLNRAQVLTTSLHDTAFVKQETAVISEYFDINDHGDSSQVIRRLALKADEKAFQLETSQTALEHGYLGNLFGLSAEPGSLKQLAFAYHQLSDVLWDATTN